MLKNCEITKREIAERFRESGDLWDAVEHWAKRRLAGGNPVAVNLELIERMEYLLNWYETTPLDDEPEGLNGDGAA